MGSTTRKRPKQPPANGGIGGVRDRIRELRRVPASELRPNPKNWRTHPPEQKKALQGVLAEIGFAGALLAREADDGSLVLIDGHLRAETTPDMDVPVLVLDVTEHEADLLLATFDPLSAMAGTESSKLESLLREANTGNEALQQMLTDLAEQEGIIPGLQDPGAGGDEFDAEAALEGECRVKPGELWLIDGGKHRLLCGDSTKAEDVGRVLDGNKPFLMVTDPPYGVSYDPNWRNETADSTGHVIGATATGRVANDDRIDWTDAWSLFHGDVAYVWHAGVHAGAVAASLYASKFDIRAQIIWSKHRMVIGRGHYHWHHEPCWYAVKKGQAAKWGGDRTQTTIWAIQHVASETGHGTQKPIECMARPIRNHGGADDHVYDPFLGSGTTIIAAHRLGRRCFGLELEPKYCEVILRRCEAEGMSVERANA